MEPLYWIIMAIIIASSQLLDWATTSYFLNKGGWKEVNPCIKETVSDSKKFLITKCVATVVLLLFLFGAYVSKPDMESFCLASAGVVVMSCIVAFANPAIVCFYFLKDLYTEAKQVRSE